MWVDVGLTHFQVSPLSVPRSSSPHIQNTDRDLFVRGDRVVDQCSRGVMSQLQVPINPLSDHVHLRIAIPPSMQRVRRLGLSKARVRSTWRECMESGSETLEDRVSGLRDF